MISLSNTHLLYDCQFKRHEAHVKLLKKYFPVLFSFIYFLGDILRVFHTRGVDAGIKFFFTGAASQVPIVVTADDVIKDGLGGAEGLASALRAVGMEEHAEQIALGGIDLNRVRII